MPLSRRDLAAVLGLLVVVAVVVTLVLQGGSRPSTRSVRAASTPTSTSVYIGPTPSTSASPLTPAGSVISSPPAQADQAAQAAQASQPAPPAQPAQPAQPAPSSTTARAQDLARLAERAQADLNPLAAGPWAVDRGPQNGLYPAYDGTSGTTRALLGRITQRPRATWFTESDSDSTVGGRVSAYIEAQQAEYGDDALIQMSVFREWPDGEDGRDRPLTRDEQASYKQWVDTVANAIGDARVAMILEPDLGLNAAQHHTADPSVRLGLVRYAAQRFSALDRTSVYLDASDADWLPVGTVVPILEAAGVQYARGFALGATHYSSVPGNLDYGTQVVQALAADGIPGKHFVIDTADNGHPFTWTQYRDAHPGSDFDNAVPCTSDAQTVCDALGIPPTPRTTSYPGLSATQTAEAQQYADGYLWFGRPWLDRQAAPFDLERSVEVARFTPFR